MFIFSNDCLVLLSISRYRKNSNVFSCWKLSDLLRQNFLLPGWEVQSVLDRGNVQRFAQRDDFKQFGKKMENPSWAHGSSQGENLSSSSNFEAFLPGGIMQCGGRLGDCLLILIREISS